MRRRPRATPAQARPGTGPRSATDLLIQARSLFQICKLTELLPVHSLKMANLATTVRSRARFDPDRLDSSDIGEARIRKTGPAHIKLVRRCLEISAGMVVRARFLPVNSEKNVTAVITKSREGA